MSDTIGYDQIVVMLRCGAEEIIASKDELSRLDSFGGDGDHGTTMARAMVCMENAISQAAAGDIKGLFNDVGWAIMGVDGGATGPLLGSFFMGFSEAADGIEAVDGSALADMFEGGLANVSNLTKARAGDKTMMDALVPAVAQLRSAVNEGLSISEALKRAWQAALAGVEATRGMQARFGRAKNIGENSIGQADPGATSISLLFKGFSKGVK